MAPILLPAIAVAAAAAMLGSAAFQLCLPVIDLAMSPPVEKRRQIASGGYRIHAAHPESSPDELPADDMRRLLWMKNGSTNASLLSAESVFEIAGNVDRSISHGE